MSTAHIRQLFDRFQRETAADTVACRVGVNPLTQFGSIATVTAATNPITTAHNNIRRYNTEFDMANECFKHCIIHLMIMCIYTAIWHS